MKITAEIRAAAETYAEQRETGAMDLTTALAAIAAYFYDVEPDQRGRSVNTLAYAQRDVLNGICWKACMSLYQTEDRHEQAVARVKSEAAKADGTEISIRNIDTAVYWAERFETQLAAISELLAAATAMHAAVVGEEFKRPSRNLNPRGDAGNEVDRKALNARLAKYGAKIATGATVEAQRTKGVETTDGEAHAIAAE